MMFASHRKRFVGGYRGRFRPVGRREQIDQPSSRQVVELLKANTTLAVWLVFLAIGGGLLALYYGRIHYLPDIEWSSTIIYLAAASIIGGAIGLLMAMSVFLPGFIWSEFLIFDQKLVGEFCYDGTGTEPCVRSTIGYLGLPFAALLVCSHVALFLVLPHTPPRRQVILYWIIAAVILLAIALFMRRLFRCVLSQANDVGELSTGRAPMRRLLRCVLSKAGDFSEQSTGGVPENSSAKDKEIARRTFKYSFWFTISGLLSQISMFLIYRLSKELAAADFATLTFVCILGVLTANHIVAVRYRHYPRQAVVASLVAAALLLFAADRFSPLSTRIMGYYGFGENGKATLLVTDEGARIIDRLDLPQCGTGRLCNVEILSKIGDEYFMRVDDKTFTLPKSTVIARVSENSAK